MKNKKGCVTCKNHKTKVILYDCLICNICDNGSLWQQIPKFKTKS